MDIGGRQKICKTIMQKQKEKVYQVADAKCKR